MVSSLVFMGHRSATNTLRTTQSALAKINYYSTQHSEKTVKTSSADHNWFVLESNQTGQLILKLYSSSSLLESDYSSERKALDKEIESDDFLNTFFSLSKRIDRVPSPKELKESYYTGMRNDLY